MTTYRATVNEERDHSIDFNVILCDEIDPNYKGFSMRNISPQKQRNFFAFYRVDKGTQIQQVILWRFPESKEANPSLYLFSREGINQDPSGVYTGQCLSIPDQDETLTRDLLVKGNIEDLLMRTISLQERKEVTKLSIRTAA